jgi:L-ascorbate metabolism protein UlaG (beta-lactamase superfamily)
LENKKGILEGMMLQIKWYGHSMWRISNDECNILIDPFTDIGFPLITNQVADIVISSHDHFDHNNFKLITPPFQKITQIGTYQVKGVKVRMIPSSHGRRDGRNLGDNFLSLITIDQMTLLHCGDLGAMPGEDTMALISEVDVLFVPIGGHYTIDAIQAKEFIELVDPRVVFPMHYRMDKSTVDVDSFEPFSRLYKGIEKIDSDIYTINKDNLPSKLRIVKMNYE